MLLSRLIPKKKQPDEPKRVAKLPELEEFLLKKDYAGAISLLEFRRKSDPDNVDNNLWLGHCYFRAGNCAMAVEVYQAMLLNKSCPSEVNTYLACCFFYLGMYAEAKTVAEKAPKSSMQVRLLFQVAHKMGDEKFVLSYHSQLTNGLEDQLSLAAVHYLRTHYQEAINIYKEHLASNANMLALNIYMAMCYYRTDVHRVAMNFVETYLRHFPDSATALNLQACITYRSTDGASVELIRMMEALRSSLPKSAQDIIRHNLVVFRNGDGILQIMPALLDKVPEARSNLILYYLKRGELDNAMALCSDFEPQTPLEQLVKAITYTFWGNHHHSKEHILAAETFYKMVGESPVECDTIAGRGAMASYLFLTKKWDSSYTYMESFMKYQEDTDALHINMGQALAMKGNYRDAQMHFLSVDGALRDSWQYKYMLTQCYIMNNQSGSAWELYLQAKSPKEATTILKIIANDSYKMKDFYYSARAFDALERTDPSPEHWNGEKAAVSALFVLLAEADPGGNNEEMCTQMNELLALLAKKNNPQADQITNTIRNWARNHKVTLV